MNSKFPWKLTLLIGLFFMGQSMVHTYLHSISSYTTAKEEISERETKEYEEHETDQPNVFRQFHEGIRTRADQSSPQYQAGYKWRELKKTNAAAQLRKKNLRTQASDVLEWKERGPGNVPGRTRALYNVPDDAANLTWLAGSATGGIWRTTDGGTTWSERSADFPALPISSFAGDQNATVIYAGTGELISTFYSSIGNGIFKSTDKGVTWTQLASTNNHPDFSIVTRLIVDPDDANILVATTAPHNMSTDNTSAIMRSADGGLSWTKVKEITGLLEQITFASEDFNVQYVSQNGVGVWKSTDGGLTWNLSNNGMSPTGRVEISVSPVNNSWVYASCEGTLSGNGSDLYLSTNSGATWTLVDVTFGGNTVDFLEGQGFYDNTILSDPFAHDKVYFGGVSLFKATIASGTTTFDNYTITESGTESFLFLQSFGGMPYDRERLDAESGEPKITVEVRFGPGKSQWAHRFLVPPNRTNALSPNDYAYQNYVQVPFEVWDITNNQRLMVSFRDQNRNGKFDLLPEYLTNGGVDYLINSREYLYIHNVPYAVSSNSDISKTAGHLHKLKYTIFPALAEDAVWDENNLPASKLTLAFSPVVKRNANTVISADGRGVFDGKNTSNQIDLESGVHADHHCITPIVINQAAKTFKLLLGNDGGVFVSKTGTNPGVTEGDWLFKGFGYNTSQFYGADKRPLADQYIGGMQDNGTRLSPKNQSANASTNYVYAISGDGFEVLWNTLSPTRILGSTYHGEIYRTTDDGNSWHQVPGLTPSDEEFPFITKLANSKDYPDRVFTVGTKGVYVSENFGSSWKLTAITNNFATGARLYLDVEVSRANADIVWAGSGMSTFPARNLHVSVDGGKTFSATTNFNAVAMGNITRLATHPAESHTAYALFSFADAPKILRTKDLGQTWQDISGFGTGTSSNNGFPDVAVYCLYVRPDNPNVIWVGTEIGIVESRDNGVTWSLLEDFLHVPVWEMKGQDNQVVIATHGRGIWTATINAPQWTTTISPGGGGGGSGNPDPPLILKAPLVVSAGTAPTGELAFRIKTESAFDSLQLLVNSAYVKSLFSVAIGSVDITMRDVQPGALDIKVVGYKNSAPYQSQPFLVEHLDLFAPKNAYSTYFGSVNDVSVHGMTLQSFPEDANPSRVSLQTDHNYVTGKDYQVTLRTPIIVSSTLPTMYYRDIALVEPQEDSVIIEATKNGIDWKPLRNSYNAALNTNWNTAFKNNQQATSNMYVDHEVDISDAFAPDDLILIRLKLKSRAPITGWGWAIAYITIQEAPVGIAPATPAPNIELHAAYPNPAIGSIAIEYTMTKAEPVVIDFFDMYGRKVKTMKAASRNIGQHTDHLDLSTLEPGQYLIVLQSANNRTVFKILIE